MLCKAYECLNGCHLFAGQYASRGSQQLSACLCSFLQGMPTVDFPLEFDYARLDEVERDDGVASRNDGRRYDEEDAPQPASRYSHDGKR